MQRAEEKNATTVLTLQNSSSPYPRLEGLKNKERERDRERQRDRQREIETERDRNRKRQT